jgi:hypothetical protein
MGIHKSGSNYFAGAVDLDELLAMFLDPGIAEGVLGWADGDDLASQAEDGNVLEDAEVLKPVSAVWALLVGGKRQELPDAGEE